MNDASDVLSLSQAQRLKRLAQEVDLQCRLCGHGRREKDELDKVVIKNDTLRKYFPRSYTPKQMEDTIIKRISGSVNSSGRMNADTPFERKTRPGLSFLQKLGEKAL